MFIPDAKRQMHTHSSLPLPKPEVSNFVEFINSLRDLLKNIFSRLSLQRLGLISFRLAKKSAC
jgi:hypothetical protein